MIALLRLVNERFVFDPWQPDAHLRQRADELIASPGVGGCGAYALVEVAMVRALGLPARLVLTADADWLRRYQADGLSVISGHAFVEVEEAAGRWLLLDPIFQVLYEHYRPGQPFYPGCPGANSGNVRRPSTGLRPWCLRRSAVGRGETVRPSAWLPALSWSYLRG